MNYQPIYDIAELCAKKGLKHIVLCPGSRCAPLTLAFTRHPDLSSKTFSDERSAGFTALGMAQQTENPVVLVCTSGTAAYNFAPAVAEAYFNHTPLIIFTADRPSEWIAQHDGQTIYQSEIFGKHVKKSFQLPQEYEHQDSQWAINRIVNEAINLARQQPCGPVHINAPFREPLYPATHETIPVSGNVRVIEEHLTSFELSKHQQERIRRDWLKFNKIAIVSGQLHYDNTLLQSLKAFLNHHEIPVIADVISNLHELEPVIQHSDLFLAQASTELKTTLQPDLLITIGKSLISKNLKLFLRNFSPQAHWHIQPCGTVADTFKSITDVFNATPATFFDFLTSLPRHESFEQLKQLNYCKLWKVEERRMLRCLENFLDEELSELELVQEIIQNLPNNSNLHLANSMSVRYANFIGLSVAHTGIKVFSNRGTSGIDGCSSTSVGHALTSTEPHILITGDVAFFYDRNAFWHNYALPNLRIVLLNNHGGSIFNMIDGPASQPEAAEYFITRQHLNAKKLCEEFDFEHLKLDSKRKIKNFLKDFFDFDGKTKVLELETDTHFNKTILENLKQKIKNSYE
jgi:2-succinyl-5-enolpyruvyl-6-hydroxy-3-cyclohexene-1-carboxylate synthase